MGLRKKEEKEPEIFGSYQYLTEWKRPEAYLLSYDLSPFLRRVYNIAGKETIWYFDLEGVSRRVMEDMYILYELGSRRNIPFFFAGENLLWSSVAFELVYPIGIEKSFPCIVELQANLKYQVGRVKGGSLWQRKR